MVRFRFQCLLRTTLLAMALLFAQLVSAGHIDLDDSHPAGELCATCVIQAQLGSANVGAPLFVDVDVQNGYEIEFFFTSSPWRRIELRFARGPPQLP